MRVLATPQQQQQQRQHHLGSELKQQQLSRMRGKAGSTVRAKKKQEYSLSKLGRVESLFLKGDDAELQQHAKLVDTILFDNTNVESWYQLIIYEQLLLGKQEPAVELAKCPEFMYNVECSLQFAGRDANYFPQLQLKWVSLLDDNVSMQISILKQVIDANNQVLQEHLIEAYLKLAELQQSAGDWVDALETIDQGLQRVDNMEGYDLTLKRQELLLRRPKEGENAKEVQDDADHSESRINESRTQERPSTRRKSNRRSIGRRRVKLLGKATRQDGTQKQEEDEKLEEEEEEEEEEGEKSLAETPMVGNRSPKTAPRVTFAPSVTQGEPSSPKAAPTVPSGPSSFMSPARAKMTTTPKVLYSSPARRPSRLSTMTPASSAKPETPSRVLFRSAVKAPPPQQAVNKMPVAGDRVNFSAAGINLQVLSKLGEGGYASVWKVLDGEGRVLALKCMKSRDEFDHELRILRLFQNDAVFLKQYCIRMIHAERSHTISFLLFEQGSLDLRRILSRSRGGLPAVDIRYYWSRCVRCIVALHRLGVVHCDIKPSNFVMVEGRLKLIDFGIACVETLNERNTKGTLAYMPYDLVSQLVAKKPPPTPTRARDIWALGCLLYELAYGITPYRRYCGSKEQSVLMQAIADSETPTHFKFGEITELPTLQSTVNSCMQLNPAARPSAAQLLKFTILQNT